MSLTEVLPVIRSLPRSDRVQLVHLLIDELAKNEPDLSVLSEYPQTVWPPEDNSVAAGILLRMLEQEQAVP